MICESKQNCNEIIVNKLKSNTVSSRDWWTTLQTVIAPNTTTSIPPLQNNESVSHNDLDKANILNDFFRDQTVSDESNAVLPQIDLYTVNSNMFSIYFSPVEIESVLNLKTGKKLQVRMEFTTVFFVNSLRNLLSPSAYFLTFIETDTCIFPQCWKAVHIKTEFVHFRQTTALFLSCVLQQKLWKKSSLNIDITT